MGFLAPLVPIAAGALGLTSGGAAVLGGIAGVGANLYAKSKAKKVAAQTQAAAKVPQPPRPPAPFGGLGASPFIAPGQGSVGGTFVTGNNSLPVIGGKAAAGKKTLLGQ